VADRVDQTSLELALSDTVKKKAFIMPWANPDWVRNQKMPIPAGNADVRHRFEFDPTGFLGRISGGVLKDNQAVRIHAAGFHQHMLGTGGRIELLRGDGAKECMLDVPRWDFHWQRSFGFSTPKTLRVGDQLVLVEQLRRVPARRQRPAQSAPRRELGRGYRRRDVPGHSLRQRVRAQSGRRAAPPHHRLVEGAGHQVRQRGR
jgi:hypothetical protein